jgi:hypothetical protein
VREVAHAQWEALALRSLPAARNADGKQSGKAEVETEAKAATQSEATQSEGCGYAQALCDEGKDQVGGQDGTQMQIREAEEAVSRFERSDALLQEGSQEESSAPQVTR